LTLISVNAVGTTSSGNCESVLLSNTISDTTTLGTYLLGYSVSLP